MFASGHNDARRCGHGLLVVGKRNTNLVDAIELRLLEQRHRGRASMTSIIAASYRRVYSARSVRAGRLRGRGQRNRCRKALRGRFGPPAAGAVRRASDTVAALRVGCAKALELRSASGAVGSSEPIECGRPADAEMVGQLHEIVDSGITVASSARSSSRPVRTAASSKTSSCMRVGSALAEGGDKLVDAPRSACKHAAKLFARPRSARRASSRGSPCRSGRDRGGRVRTRERTRTDGARSGGRRSQRRTTRCVDR